MKAGGWHWRRGPTAQLIVVASLFFATVAVLREGDRSAKVEKLVDTITLLPRRTEFRRDTEQICQDLLEVLFDENSNALRRDEAPAPSVTAKSLADEIDSDASPYALGLKALAEERYDDARHFLGIAEGRSAVEPIKLYTARSELEFYAGKPDAAVHWIRLALHEKPDDAELLEQLAVAFAKGEKYDEAQRAFEGAEKMAPDENWLATIKLAEARMLLAEDQAGKAQSIAEWVLKVQTAHWGVDHSAIRDIRAVLRAAQLRVGKSAEAEITLTEALKDRSGLQGRRRVFAAADLGTALLEQGKYQTAKRYLTMCERPPRACT